MLHKAIVNLAVDYEMQAKKNAHVVEAFYPYQASDENQLSLLLHEKVEVLSKDPSGWWVGRNAEGHIGVFPSTFTREPQLGTPDKHVLREFFTARLRRELGLSHELEKERTMKPSTAVSPGMRGFAIVTDLDHDDLYTMTERELDAEMNRLVQQREKLRGLNEKALRRVVDSALLERETSEVAGSSCAQINGVMEEGNASQAQKPSNTVLAPHNERVIMANDVSEVLARLLASDKVEKDDEADATGEFHCDATTTTSQSERREAALFLRQQQELRDAPTAAVEDHAVTLAARRRVQMVRQRIKDLERKLRQFQEERDIYQSLLKERGLDVPACLSVPFTPPAVIPIPLDDPEDAATYEFLKDVHTPAILDYCAQLLEELDYGEEMLHRKKHERKKAKAKLQNEQQELQQVQAVCQTLETSHKKLRQEFTAKLEARQTTLDTTLTELQERTRATSAGRSVEQLRCHLALAEEQLTAGKQSYRALEEEIRKLRKVTETLEEQQAFLSETERLRAEIHTAAKEEAKFYSEVRDIQEKSNSSCAADLLRYRQLERERREVFNKIQELKGNLRVYCRIKPLSGSQKGNVLELADDMTLRVRNPDTFRVSDHEFDFVIGPTATQEEIFEEVRPLATSVLDGYNVCIFAYGQTGSGKTYTMEGPADNRGINYRVVKELFTLAKERGADYQCQLRVSIVEIYNDKPFDLQANRAACKIRWGGEKEGVIISPLVKQAVSSVNDVQCVLEQAYKSRSVAGTDCNAHSSRSHCILTVYLSATNGALQNNISAKLHLIDLAGSERVKHSGAEGTRLKEATHINTSLTHLKTVIQGLANKNTFVAYRNSALTSILQDSLGGNCKCLMFANISGAESDLPESICTMKYAAEARKVEVGHVSANTRSTAQKKKPANPLP